MCWRNRCLETAAAAFLALGLSTFSVNLAAAQGPPVPESTRQFGKLVGEWKIADRSLQQDGTWTPGPGADWNWYYILDGHAIQDDWISPGLDSEPGPNGRQYGTNIRVYDPKDERWEMAWISNMGHTLDTFTAESDDHSVVMRGVFGGAETRITFYAITDKTFEWKMERYNEEQDTWTEVYRIHGERK